MERNYLKVVDSRLNVYSEKNVDHVFKEGAQNVAYVPLTSSSHSNAGTNFALNNIGEYNCRDSRLVMSMPVTVQIPVTNSTGAPLSFITSDNFGYRQFPLNSIIQNNSHTINQASYSLNTSELLPLISRVTLNPEDMNFYQNTMPDVISSYARATGTNFNPLAPYTSSLEGEAIWKPRTLGLTITNNIIPANTTQTVNVSCQLYEPLIDPFTNISSESKSGLFSVTGEQIQLVYVSKLFDNMFSLGNVQTGLTYSAPTVSLGANATLFCIYLTPYEHTTSLVPKESVIPYNNYQQFVTNCGAVAAGASINISSQVASLTNMPAKFIIAAVPSVGSRSASLPNVALTFNSVSVSIDNGQPQLSAASNNQLYDISRESGLSMSRQSFLGQVLNGALNASDPTNNPVLTGCGSVLVLEPSQLGVRPGLAEGSVGKFIFQVTNATFTNNTGTNLGDVSLYIIAVSNAILKRRGTEYTNGLLTVPDNVNLMARNLPTVDYSEYRQGLQRNSFMSGSGIKDFFRKAWNMIKTKGLEHLQQNPQLVAQAVKALSGGKKAPTKKKMDLFYE
jgi:hypothetical protein